MHPAFYSLIGLAVGDAIGTTHEFELKFNPRRPVQTDMVGGGPFGLFKGEWTDDTSMALAMAVSLIITKDMDLAKIQLQFDLWYQLGKNAVSMYSSNGKCFDIGNATRGGIQHFRNTGKPVSNYNDILGGNGSMMRLAPVPMLLHQDPHMAIEFSGYSSLTTHNHAGSVDACRYLGALIVGAIQGATKQELLNGFFVPKGLPADYWTQNPLCTDVERAVTAPRVNNTQSDIPDNSGGSVDSLKAILWHLEFSNSFEEGVLKISNLGGDSDTVAAIYGQVAGPLYRSIRQDWIDALSMSSFLQAVAVTLCHMSEGVAFTIRRNESRKFSLLGQDRGQNNDRDQYQKPGEFTVTVEQNCLATMVYILQQYEVFAVNMSNLYDYFYQFDYGRKPLFDKDDDLAINNIIYSSDRDMYTGRKLPSQLAARVVEDIYRTMERRRFFKKNMLLAAQNLPLVDWFVPRLLPPTPLHLIKDNLPLLFSYMFKMLLKVGQKEDEYHRCAATDVNLRLVFKIKPSSTTMLSGQLYKALLNCSTLIEELSKPLQDPNSFCVDYMFHLLKANLEKYIDLSWIRVPGASAVAIDVTTMIENASLKYENDMVELKDYADVTHSFVRNREAETFRQSFFTAIELRDWLEWTEILTQDTVYIPKHFQLLYTNNSFSPNVDASCNLPLLRQFNMFHNSASVNPSSDASVGFHGYNKLYARTPTEKLWLFFHLQLQQLHLHKMRNCGNLCGL